jgi:hypothetical protein
MHVLGLIGFGPLLLTLRLRLLLLSGGDGRWDWGDLDVGESRLGVRRGNIGRNGEGGWG